MAIGDISSLWTLPVRVSSPDVGILTWDILVLLIIAFLTIRSFYKIRWEPHFLELRIVLAGLVFLTAFYTLHVIDLAVHNSGAVVPYGYLFVTAIFYIPRTISDLLTLLGCLEIHLKYFQKRPYKPNFRWLWGISCLLALMQTCMLFGLVICWMSPVDGDALEDIARGRSALEVCSATLSFMTALVLTTVDFLRTMQSGETLYGPRSHTREAFTTTLVPLLARTFCELVIVGEYDRNRYGIDLDSASKARDVCHGLFSAGFALGISDFIKYGKGDIVESIREDVDAKMGPFIDTRLNTITARGSRTAPQLSDLFEQLKSTVPQGSQHQPLEANLRKELSSDYLERLSTRYKGWVPIRRWLGATPKPAE